MTVESWPSTLNYFVERGTYRLTPSDNQLRSEFDAGPSRMRRRFTQSIPKFEFSILMKESEIPIFKSFYFNLLNNGVNWFQMPIWDGSSYIEHTARFTEPYNMSDAGYGLTLVSLKLEARGLNILPEYAAVIIGRYGEELPDRLQVIVNMTYNQITQDY